MVRSFAGRLPIIAPTAYVDLSAQVLGDVTLGDHASVWMNAVVRGDVHSITIGPGSNVQDCAVLHGMRGRYAVTIGRGVTIGHNATVHGCTIEDDVLIGIGAIVLNGAVIGAGSIIAAGALVPERTNVPPRSLVTGVPGRILRETTEGDLEQIKMYARNYIDYTKTYLEAAQQESRREPRRRSSTIAPAFARTTTIVRE